MALHTQLPIYKRGCQLVALAFTVQQQMPRGMKHTLGTKITVHCTDMVNLMAMANASRGQDRVKFIKDLLMHSSATTVLLRVCHEMRYISPKLWADSIELIGNIESQGGTRLHLGRFAGLGGEVIGQEGSEWQVKLDKNGRGGGTRLFEAGELVVAA